MLRDVTHFQGALRPHIPERRDLLFSVCARSSIGPGTKREDLCFGSARASPGHVWHIHIGLVVNILLDHVAERDGCCAFVSG